MLGRLSVNTESFSWTVDLSTGQWLSGKLRGGSMGANCREDNSLLFWGSGKTNYTNSTSIILLNLFQFYSRVKKYVSFLGFFLFVNFQNVGQCSIWREIMWGEVSSIIHSSMLWVWEERWERELIHQPPNDVPFSSRQNSRTVLLCGFLPLGHLKAFFENRVMFAVQSWSLIFGDQNVSKLWSYTVTLMLPQKMIRQSVCLTATSSRPWSHYLASVLKSPLSWDTMLHR